MPPRLISRIRAVAANRDAGMTITELVVGMALSTILGALAVTLVVAIGTSTASTTDRTVNSSSARNTILAWTAYLRVADGPTAGVRLHRIEWLTPGDMLFYADLGNRSLDTVATISAPTMIWLRRDYAGTLIEEQFSSNAASGAIWTRCRKLVFKATTSTALFTPVDSRGASMTAQHLDLGVAPSPTLGTVGCQRLPATVRSQPTTAQANLQNVVSVTIDLVVRDSKGKNPLEFTSQAVLPSLGGAS